MEAVYCESCLRDPRSDGTNQLERLSWFRKPSRYFNPWTHAKCSGLEQTHGGIDPSGFNARNHSGQVKLRKDQNVKNTRLKKRDTVVQLTIPDEIRLMNFENYSLFNKLVRVTAWIKRFANNIKQPGQRRGALTSDEIIDAKKYWIAATQIQAFPKEIVALKDQQPVYENSKIKSFNQIIDSDNIVRAGGRLQFSNNEESVKLPIILPANHRFTTLLIEEEHRRLLHAGVQDTLTQLRETYWIIMARQDMQKVIRCCLTCQRQSCAPDSEPVAPQLSGRVSRCEPFESTAVDLAGLLICRHHYGSSKVYIAPFTCAVTRAVHLELVSDLSTTAFLLAFKRFIARRGIAKAIYSDNA